MRKLQVQLKRRCLVSEVYSRSFGVPTAGYASANIVVDMPDGAGIMLTVAKDVARTGEEFAEEPVKPDVVTDNPEAEATRWLSEECGVK